MNSINVAMCQYVNVAMRKFEMKIVTTKDNLQILHEDNHLIVINKSVGDIAQGDNSGDKPLPDIVKEYLKEKYNKPGDVFLGVVHRLDRPTTGIVVFAKTSKALTRMNDLFSSGKHKKRIGQW
jgi:23S rRNA pseudouridine1911/1915/1917 synthase